MTNTIAKSRELSAFVVEETTKGTLAYPTVDTEMLVLTEQPTMKQQPTFSDSKEINDTLDTLDRFQDQIGAGQFTLDFYNRPAGAGVVPMGGVLFESIQGADPAVSSGVSVEYAQAKTKTPFSVWYKQGHTVYNAAGGCAETLKMNLTNKGAFECNFGGGFMKKGWAGTDSASAATASGTASGYTINEVSGYTTGDTVLTLQSGAGTVLDNDILTFSGDLTNYFVETGLVASGSGDITLKAPGLTQPLGDSSSMTLLGNSNIAVTNGKLFTAGALVQVAADTNSNVGYKITSIVGNDLFFDVPITCADAAVVKGFIPVTFSAVGAPVESKNNTISFDGITKILKSLTIDIASPVEWQNEEINESGYVESYVESKRTIKITADSLFREQDLQYFYDALDNAQIPIIATMDGGAGKTCTINLLYTELEEPAVTAGENTVSLSLGGVCLGDTAGENSATIVFT